MIKNQEDTNLYKTYNKVYIPQNLTDQNYVYRFNGDYITIKTNNNCRTQYSTTYCDCIQYNYKLNVSTNTYECSIGNETQIIPFTSISNDINDSLYIKERFYQDKTLMIAIFILALIFALLLTRKR